MQGQVGAVMCALEHPPAARNPGKTFTTHGFRTFSRLPR